MDKYGFVKELTICLTNKVDQRELDDTISYYQDYIDMEIQKGRTEEEVLSSLGSPRLLARTIIDAKGYGGMGSQSYQQGSDGYDETEHSGGVYMGGRRVSLGLIGIFVFLMIILIFALFFRVLTFFLPVFLIAALFTLAYRLLTGGW